MVPSKMLLHEALMTSSEAAGLSANLGRKSFPA